MNKPYSSLLGLDIIVHPEHMRGCDIHSQGKVVEINGSNSGMSFYQHGDMEFYSRLATGVKQLVGDKTVLIKHTPLHEFELVRTKIQQQALDEIMLRDLQYNEAIVNSPDTGFQCIRDTATDYVRMVRHQKRKYVRPGRPYLIRAMRQAGVRVQEYSYAKVSPSRKSVAILTDHVDSEYMADITDARGNAELPLASGLTFPPFSRLRKTIDLKSIGLIWDDPSVLNTLEKVALNGEELDSIIDDKLLQYLFHEFTPSDLQKFTPSTFLYGCGMHHHNNFRTWLSESDAELFIRKPLNLMQGAGVRFYSRDEMEQFTGEVIDTSADIRHEINKIAYLTKQERDFIFDRTVLFQELVPSAKIMNPHTGVEGSACARAIVFNGEFMGAYWRSNGVGDQGTLEDQLVHNLSNKAYGFAMSEEHTSIVKELAESATRALFSTVSAVVRKGLIDDPNSFLGWGVADELKQVLMAKKLAKTAQSFGIEMSTRYVEEYDVEILNSLDHMAIDYEEACLAVPQATKVPSIIELVSGFTTTFMSHAPSEKSPGDAFCEALDRYMDDIPESEAKTTAHNQILEILNSLKGN